MGMIEVLSAMERDCCALSHLGTMGLNREGGFMAAVSE